MQETQIWSLGWEDPLEKEMATPPVFLPGESHGLNDVERVTSSFTALGFGANCQVLFYAQIDESMKLGLGGGIGDEKIELVFIKRSEILDFIYDESKIKAPNLQFSILWWMINKNPK